MHIHTTYWQQTGLLIMHLFIKQNYFDFLSHLWNIF